MRVLVACEESQAVCIELRALGHEAYSCDTAPQSGGHPEWHVQQDVLSLLNGYCEFDTCDGQHHLINSRWDMIIAFPPCTYLTNAGAVRLRVNGVINEERMAKAIKAKEFFMAIYNADCDRIVIENPVPGKIHGLPPYQQIIEPYMFGEPWRKKNMSLDKGRASAYPDRYCRAARPMGWRIVCGLFEVSACVASFAESSIENFQGYRKGYG